MVLEAIIGPAIAADKMVVSSLRTLFKMRGTVGEDLLIIERICQRLTGNTDEDLVNCGGGTTR